MSVTKKFKRWTRSIRHWVAFGCLHILSTSIRALPLEIIQRLGQYFGLICRLILFSERQKVQNRLAQSILVDRPNRLLKQIEKSHWKDLGQRLFEWLAAKKSLSLFDLDQSSLDQLHQIQKAAHDGRAQVILTAHYGHWELMAAYLSTLNFKYWAVASLPSSGLLGRWLTQHRQSLGVHTVHPQGGAKQIRQYLKSGGVIALLIDQSTKERRFYYPFLGRMAPLSLTADRLINLSNAEVHWLSNMRQNNGRYAIHLRSLLIADHPPVSFASDPSFIKGKYTIQAHKFLEKCIHQSPEQWLWMHSRWIDREHH